MKSNIKVSSGECIFYFKIENRNFVQKLFAYLRTINPITAIRPRCTRPESWKGQKLDFLVLEKFSGKMEIFLANTGPSCNPQELPFLCKATAKEMRQRTSSQASGYASPKLWPTYSLTHLLTGVKCRATSVAKNSLYVYRDEQIYMSIIYMCQ